MGSAPFSHGRVGLMRKMHEMEALVRLGEGLERGPEHAMQAMSDLLRVRDRQGRMRSLRANPAQARFERGRGRENVVLKARQMGISTWVTGRFFLKTITQPGTLTLQVAHTRETAEALLGLARRMWEELPEALRKGPLQLERSNTGQMVFGEIGSEIRVASASDGNAGRGLSVQNLHLSEVGRWHGDAAATMAGLRAALAPGGEMVVESTPSGAYGAFYEAWRSGVDAGRGVRGEPTLTGGEAAGEDGAPGLPGGMVRHFLPWWLEPAYTGVGVGSALWTAEERLLVERHGLTPGQIGFRRGLESRYGALRTQEFAEDPETCFRATGSCCFELEVLERRLTELPEPMIRRRNGLCRSGCRP